MSIGEPKFQFTTPWLHDAASPGGPPMALTDMGNADRLVIAHADDLRFLHQTRQWHVWDGTRFAVAEHGEAKRRAKETVRGMLIEAHIQQDNEELRKQITAHQIRSESSRAIEAMLSLAESDEKIAACASDFDRDSLLFNVENGTLDLRTGELREHDRHDLITKLAHVEFASKATAPTWDKFLSEIMDDVEKVAFLQRAVGYSMTGDVSESCYFMLYGTGANGKSTFIEVLRAVFGDYAMQADFQTFLSSKGNGARPDIARLRAARFVTAVECDAGKRLAENVVKYLTGGDTVTARHLYSKNFEFTPSLKLWMATNNKPRIFATDTATWRRVRLIPFTVTIPEEKRDRELLHKLKAELPGILNWMLAGLAEWRERGLATPKAITEASEDYRQREDSLGRFIEESVRADPESRVSASELYGAYKNWTERTGEFQMKEKDFSDDLQKRGFQKHRYENGKFWKCVRLNERASMLGM